MAREMKYTPGPWGLVRVDESSGEFVYQAMAGGYVIANIAESDYPANEIARAKFDAELIVAAPALADVVRDLCVQLACAGEEAKADSLNPLEALFARALAAYEAATGIPDPFAHAMAQVCADNRAAIAKATGSAPRE